MSESSSPEHAPATEVADELIRIVEEAWRAVEDGVGGFAPKDPNEVVFFLAFARAFRCFESIQLLVQNEHDDDAFILTRGLASIILRSLDLVQPEDEAEREDRYIRQSWDALQSEAKRLRALDDPRDADHRERVEASLAEDVAWFEARDMNPALAADSDMAKRLGLGTIYDLVYRTTSSITHFSIFAALGGFVGRPAEGEHFPPISLRKPEPAMAENALVWSIAIYGDFLTRADEVMELGIKQPVIDLVQPWLENHPYMEKDK